MTLVQYLNYKENRSQLDPTFVIKTNFNSISLVNSCDFVIRIVSVRLLLMRISNNRMSLSMGGWGQWEGLLTNNYRTWQEEANVERIRMGWEMENISTHCGGTGDR